MTPLHPGQEYLDAMERLEPERKRAEAFGSFFEEMIRELSDENRKQGNDTDVTGVVVG